MELPNVSLPFLDFHCSSECAADCDRVHISWKVQETVRASEWEPVGGSSKCSPLPGAWTDEQIVTSAIPTCSLPVIPYCTNSTATESELSESVKVEAWPDVMAPISESESLRVGTMTGVSISHGGGCVSMLTQHSLTDRSFTQAAAVISTPTLSDDKIHSVAITSAAAALPIREASQQSLAAPPFTDHHLIHSVLNAPAVAAAAALPVTLPSAALKSQSLQQEESAQASRGSFRDGTQALHDGTRTTREGTLYDMIVSGGFKRKGSASWWGDSSTTQPLKRHCLVGDNVLGSKGPVSGTTGSGSLAAGSQCATVGLEIPRRNVEPFSPFSTWTDLAPIPVVGSTVGIVGSVAVSRPPAAAIEGAALLDPLWTLSGDSLATQWAVQPADSAHQTPRDQADGNGLGLERPPIHRRSAAGKLRRHRISAGFKRLEKVLPPSWMRQKHQSKLSTRTDMASLLDAAVDFIRELEDRRAQLAQAYIQQFSKFQQ